MKILILSPKFRKTEWDFNSLFSLAEKPKLPPKETLLISILFPITWDRKIVDLNHEKLLKKDIIDADYIFITAKEEQYNSTQQIIKMCRLLDKKVVGSGPLFTEYFAEFENLDHLVLDNTRVTMPEFIIDLENEKLKKVYHSNPFFEIRKTTETSYSLASISAHFSENIQIA